MDGAKSLDELWVEVKCQSNPEIAGSPRNALRCSLSEMSSGGRALNGLGGKTLTKPNQTTNARRSRLGVSPWGINFTDKRGTTQTTG